jgi:plastocyanin
LVHVIGGECCPGAAPAVDESTVVNDDGSLKDVVVYVKDGPNVQQVSQGTSPATLDQKDCRYVPHVLALRTGQPLDVTSHDPTIHNVHVLASANESLNFAEAAVGATRQLTFAAPEFIRVKCDVHPWMNASIAVFDHPFFAVTGDDGQFKLDRLPIGNYTLVAWHEKYGTIEKSFSVTGSTPVDVQFDYGK